MTDETGRCRCGVSISGKYKTCYSCFKAGFGASTLCWRCGRALYRDGTCPKCVMVREKVAQDEQDEYDLWLDSRKS